MFRLVGEDQYFSNPFGSQAVASYVGSSAGYPFVESAVNGAFEIGVSPLPQEGGTPYVTSWGSHAMIFPSDEARQRAMFEFLAYFTSAPVLAQWAADFGGVPAFESGQKEAVFTSFLEQNQAIAAHAVQASETGYLPAIPGSAAAKTEFERAIEAVATQQKSAEQALADAESAANSELQK